MYACAYQNCIVAQNYELKNVIKIKQRINRIEERAKSELKQRLKVSYGLDKEKERSKRSSRNIRSYSVSNQDKG